MKPTKARARSSTHDASLLLVDAVQHMAETIGTMRTVERLRELMEQLEQGKTLR